MDMFSWFSFNKSSHHEPVHHIEHNKGSTSTVQNADTNLPDEFNGEKSIEEISILASETSQNTTEQQNSHNSCARDIFCIIPKRIVVAAMIFLTTSVYFLIYTSFNILLLVMVKLNETEDNNGILHANVGTRYAWTDTQQIQALCVFQIGEAISSVPAGILVEKRGPKFIIGIGIALAGSLSFIIPFAARLGISFMCMWRLLQGFCCSEVLLGCHFLISQWAPRHEQCKFVWTLLGGMLGTSYTIVLVMKLLEVYEDYFIVFYITGSISIAWGLIWIIMISDNPRKHPFISRKELNYISRTMEPTTEHKFHFMCFNEVFTSRRFWALLALTISHENGLFTLITLGPAFFQQFYKKMSLWETFLPTMCRLFFALACSIIVDMLSRRKFFKRTLIVKAFVIISHFMPGTFLCLILRTQHEFRLAYLIYNAAIVCMGAAVVTTLNNFHDLAPNHAAQLSGFARLFALFIAVVTRHITSGVQAVKSASEAWDIIFFLAAGVYFVGGIIFILYGSAKLQKWNFHQSSFQYYIFEALSNLEFENKIKTN